MTKTKSIALLGAYFISSKKLASWKRKFLKRRLEKIRVWNEILFLNTFIVNNSYPELTNNKILFRSIAFFKISIRMQIWHQRLRTRTNALKSTTNVHYWLIFDIFLFQSDLLTLYRHRTSGRKQRVRDD